MKKFMYLLMALMVMSGLSMNAQTYGKPYRSQHAQQRAVYATNPQVPTVEMRSTSTFSSSGSALPQAAITGTFTADEAASPAHIGAIRRSVGGGGFADDDDENPEDKDDPTPDLPGEPNPLGDVFWPLALLACVYALMRVFLKRKRA